MSIDDKPETPPDEHHFEEGDEAPPPGVRTMAIVRWALLALMALVAAASIASYVGPLLAQGAPNAESKAKYYCPMHPQITSEFPGECPICHMTLEPIPHDRKKAAAPPSASRTPNASAAAGSAGASASSAPQTPPGTVPVTLALDRVQAIGVRTATVEKIQAGGSVRVTAAVEAPDQGRAEVHARSAGFVEAIAVRQEGVKVKAGQLLASIYSPELYQAQSELLAMQAFPASGPSAPPIEAARKRLELLGMGKGSIDAMLKSGKPSRTVGISSPISGYVVKKNVFLGSSVSPEMTLFEIADLGKVYVIASVYPHQLGAIHVGDMARFETPSVPNRFFEAKVDLVYPEVDLATRTARVRFQVDNKDLSLRPGQFGVAQLMGTGARPEDALAVPLDSIIDTGRSTYVFVVEDGGRYAPTLVELGAQMGDKVVVRGLPEGARVVSGATFLLDAESRLQASLMGRSAAAPAGSAGPSMGAPSGCDADFDRAKFPDKWADCKKCEAHRGMGSMEEDCRNQIPKPWR